ncbi:MAG TPA: serine hydrolase, partial [Vicinamibacterales bacterium]|nr:serine hydrolase [Vicinamibacterales bacterium]
SAPDFRFPTHDEIVARLGEQAELYPAQTYYQYSNLGLTLVGEIVAAVSGQPYDEYVRGRILTPLGLTSTWPEIPAELHGTRMAVGHTALTREGTRQPVPVFQGRGIAPAMAFASTVEDLGRFASWQFRVLHHGAKEVLGRNTLREMHRVHWVEPDWETTRGLGFSVYRVGEKTFVGHGGSCPGYRSNLQIEPDERIATVFAAAANGVDAGAFTQRAYDVMAPALEAAADTAHEATAMPPAFAAYVGAYSELPWGGETAVIPWKGSLALLPLPTDDPIEALTELKHTGDHTFRRVRRDGELGEDIRFDVGPDGRAVRMWQHSNFGPRVR